MSKHKVLSLNERKRSLQSSIKDFKDFQNRIEKEVKNE